jgi:FAD/FMN-containing dehydrogenase
VFVLPTSPPLRGRPGADAALAIMLLAVVLFSLGVIATAITAGAVLCAALIGAVVGSPRSAARRSAAVAAAPAHATGPGTRAYSRAVRAYDPTRPLRPALAVTARTVDDVRTAIETARDAGLGVATHSTGHAASGTADLESSLLIRVRMAGEVTVDSVRRLVRIPAGAAWADVLPVLHAHGLAVPHGSSGHVGVVGYLTRGGLSAYGRHTGVAANSIESIELVTADGRELVASRESNPELFWALRGGGGGLGVVTAVTVRAFDPGVVVTGTTVFALSDAPAVAAAWARWTADAPSSITTSLRVLSVPRAPGMPRRLTGKRVLVVDGTAVDAEVSAEHAASDLLHRLTSVAEPLLDTWSAAGTAEVPFTHMDPPMSPAHASRSGLLGSAPSTDARQADAIVAAFVASTTAAESTLAVAELRQLGGALGNAPADAGAVGSLRGAFGWFAVSLYGRTGADVATASVDLAWNDVRDWATGFAVPTFATDREHPVRSFSLQTAQRAAAVRAAFDPDGVFGVDVTPGALV